ncbi:MAG: GHKL domain-containing protein [Clostridiales bacterium]|nr:GHKL domain-containing protein [Clostridiales bacterium]
MHSFEMQFNTCLLFLYIASAIMILEGFDFRRPGARLFAALLVAGVAANVLALRAFGLERYLGVYPVVSLLYLLVTTMFITRYRGIKTVFVFLTAVIWVSPLLLGAHAAALVFGPDYFVKLVSYVLIAIPMLLLLKLYFRPPLLYLLDNYHRGWALFCAVPLLCAFVSYYQTRYRFLYDLETFRETGIWQLSLSMLSFLTYLLIVEYARQIRERLEARGVSQLLQTQLQGALQHIESLKHSERQAAVYVHDLRHHLRYIHSLAAEGNRDGIMGYVAGIEQSIDQSTAHAFCKNETVNLILSSFRAQAERRGVAIEIRADIPEKLGIPDADLCVIISNALENAINAASAVCDRQRVVRFNCHTRNDQLLLEIANPFEGEVKIEDGAVADDGGLGTKSIALIVERHAGLCSFEAKGGEFALRVIL